MEADGALDAEVTTSEARQASATPTAGAGFIAKIERTLRAPLLWAALVAILLALQLCLVVLHDPWLDEWQALQIALQSPDFAALLENLRYEGHPPLWYLLLIAAGSILHPVWILPAVQTLVATTSQLLILLRAPFARWQRLLIATGDALRCVVRFSYDLPLFGVSHSLANPAVSPTGIVNDWQWTGT